MSSQLSAIDLLSFDEMVRYIGHTWARKTLPTAGSAYIVNVVHKSKSEFTVIFDEGAVRGYKVDGAYFQRHYQPVASSVRTAVPQSIRDALVAYERAVQTCSRGIAGTAQYNHLLSEQHRCKELLLRAIVSLTENPRGI